MPDYNEQKGLIPLVTLTSGVPLWLLCNCAKWKQEMEKAGKPSRSHSHMSRNYEVHSEASSDESITLLPAQPIPVQHTARSGSHAKGDHCNSSLADQPKISG